MKPKLCITALVLALFVAITLENRADAYGRVRPYYNGYGQSYYGGYFPNNSGYGYSNYGYGNGPYGYGNGYGYNGYQNNEYQYGNYNNGSWYSGQPYVQTYGPFGIGIYGGFNNGW